MDLAFPVNQSHNLMCRGDGMEWEADGKILYCSYGGSCTVSYRDERRAMFQTWFQTFLNRS